MILKVLYQVAIIYFQLGPDLFSMMSNFWATVFWIKKPYLLFALVAKVNE